MVTGAEMGKYSTEPENPTKFMQSPWFLPTCSLQEHQGDSPSNQKDAHP